MTVQAVCFSFPSRGQANSYVHGTCWYSKQVPRAGAVAVGAMASAVASVFIWTMKGAVQSEKKRYIPDLNKNTFFFFYILDKSRTYLQLPLRQWGAGNVYLLVLSCWKVNIAENPIAVMGL